MSFWKSPSSKIKIFRGAWHCLNYYFNSKQWQNSLNKNKTEKKNKRAEAYLLTCSPSGAPPGPAMRLRPSPAPHRLQPLPVGRGVSTRPHASATPPGCLPASEDSATPRFPSSVSSQSVRLAHSIPCSLPRPPVPSSSATEHSRRRRRRAP